MSLIAEDAVLFEPLTIDFANTICIRMTPIETRDTHDLGLSDNRRRGCSRYQSIVNVICSAPILSAGANILMPDINVVRIEGSSLLDLWLHCTVAALLILLAPIS
jgi:hypothetical protein